MKRVKLLCSRAGLGFGNDAGEIIEVPADEARRLIASGQAEPAPDEAKQPARGRKGNE